MFVIKYLILLFLNFFFVLFFIMLSCCYTRFFLKKRRSLLDVNFGFCFTGKYDIFIFCIFFVLNSTLIKLWKNFSVFVPSNLTIKKQFFIKEIYHFFNLLWVDTKKWASSSNRLLSVTRDWKNLVQFSKRN